jgi:hypothetical protein
MGGQKLDVHVTYKEKKDKYKKIYCGIYNIRSRSQHLGKKCSKIIRRHEINDKLNEK